MKVLITGGYGFIGSFVAERFFKEGYDVYIIDNLSNGKKAFVDFKHRSYAFSVEDQAKCEEVFRGAPFDSVIHLATHGSERESLNDPQADSRYNVLGLVNMLTLAHKYGTKKFVYVSSAAVYGTDYGNEAAITENALCRPVSPHGVGKLTAETYCERWRDIYGLDTVCFRLSNVYGPRQSYNGEDGLLGQFIEKALNGEPIEISQGLLQEKWDFLYVEDAVDALYRASYADVSGVYNLSSNTATSFSRVIGDLENLAGKVTIIQSEHRKETFLQPILDNRKAKLELDWVPMYSFSDGFRKTLFWYSENRAQAEAAVTTERIQMQEAPSKLAFLLPYAENLFLFILVALLTSEQGIVTYSFLDYKLFYIIIMGVLHGSRQSIIAFLLSSLLFVGMQLKYGRDAISLLYDTDFFFQISIYLFIGLVVGYTVERRKNNIRAMNTKLSEMEEKYAFLSDVYRETRLIKDELQQQIMNNGDSFGKIYSVTKQLESLEPEKIFTSTIGVVETIMRSQSVAIYTVNRYRSYLRLVARSKAEGLEAPKSMKVEDYPFVKKVLEEKVYFVNKDLTEGAPLLCAPVMNNGETVAVVMLYRLKFENFNLYNQNLFKVTVDLVSSSLQRAFSYVNATGSQRFVEGTHILKSDVFQDILESKRQAKEQHNVGYSLLSCEAVPGGVGEVSGVIHKSLRETDYIGLDERGSLLVLLTNSSPEDASFVMDRLGKQGLAVSMIGEDA